MIYTLPWYCKAALIVFDMTRCWVVEKNSAFSTPESVFGYVCNVFGLQSIVVLLLMAPSIFLSVADRVYTNTFCCSMLMLLSVYCLLIKHMGSGVLSTENTCFMLQFGSCYFFKCLQDTTRTKKHVLNGRGIVQSVSVASMLLFPMLYSRLLQDCMHVSPYALAMVFSGEVIACVSWLASHAICALEIVIDVLLRHVQEY